MGLDHFKRLAGNDLFRDALERARLMWAAGESTERSNALHDLHKIAFEVSILYSPNVYTSVKPREYLETLYNSANIGLHYIDTLLKHIPHAKSKVKRADLVVKNLQSMHKQLQELKSKAESLLSGDNISPRQLLPLNASLKKVRRSYFRMRPRLEQLESNLVFESYEPHEFIAGWLEDE